MKKARVAKKKLNMSTEKLRDLTKPLGDNELAGIAGGGLAISQQGCSGLHSCGNDN